jgi:hypothetical protein
MGNSASYKPFDPQADSAPALVAVLANKLLSKKESLDGHERFPDIEGAVLENVERRGDFEMLIFVEGSAQVDKSTKECPKMPIAQTLAEALLVTWTSLPKDAQDKIFSRVKEIESAVRAADAEGKTLPIKNNDKLISLATSVAQDVGFMFEQPLSPKDKAPSIRTTGTAYILHAELNNVRVAEAISPGNEVLGTVAELVANDREVAAELGVSIRTARKIAKQVQATRRFS